MFEAYYNLLIKKNLMFLLLKVMQRCTKLRKAKEYF